MPNSIELQNVSIHPTADRVVVRPIDEDLMTASGIQIVKEREKSLHGDVIAVGPGIRDINGDYIEPIVKVGDEIIFARYSGVEVKVNDEDVLVMREGDVLAILIKEENFAPSDFQD